MAAGSRLLQQGLEEFNRSEFIPCHEDLKRLWVSEQGSVREPNRLGKFDWSLVATIEMRLYDKADAYDEQR